MSVKVLVIKDFMRRPNNLLVAPGVDENGRIVIMKTMKEDQFCHVHSGNFIKVVNCRVTTMGKEVFATLESDSKVNINILYARSNYTKFAIHVIVWRRRKC